MELLKEKGLDDVLVVIGGIIPDVDIPKLKALGVKGIFLPGTPMQDIIDFINANVREPGSISLQLRQPLRSNMPIKPRCRIPCSSPTTASRFSASSS